MFCYSSLLVSAIYCSDELVIDLFATFILRRESLFLIIMLLWHDV